MTADTPLRKLHDPVRSTTEASLDIAMQALATIARSSRCEYARELADEARVKVKTLRGEQR